jgi:hypothetical protein
MAAERAKGVRLRTDGQGRRLVLTSLAHGEMLRLVAKYLKPVRAITTEQGTSAT